MNKTFKSGNEIYNACVGNNGYIDFDTYADGFKEAAFLLINAAIDRKIPMDIAIYPAVFNARHYLELFIKHQIRKANTMLYCLNGNNYKVIPINGHDLSKLWKNYKEKVKNEERLNDQINQINEFIIFDFANIDDSSETFRYPVSKGNKKHLTNIQCIDIVNFKEHFEKIVSQFEKLDEVTDFLYNEYLTGIKAGGLCRNKISQIADELPEHKTWSEPSFLLKRDEICKKYNITPTQFSKVTKEIKKHPIFAKKIGIEIPISGLQVDTFEKFIAIFDEYHKDLISYDEYIKKIMANLSKKEICSLTQLYDMGYFWLFSEQYEYGYSLKLEEDHKQLAGCYLRKGIAPEKIKLGMKIMGK